MIRLNAGGRIHILPRPAALEKSVHQILPPWHSCGATINHRAHGRTVTFTKGGEVENASELIACHSPFPVTFGPKVTLVARLELKHFQSGLVGQVLAHGPFQAG